MDSSLFFEIDMIVCFVVYNYADHKFTNYAIII